MRRRPRSLAALAIFAVVLTGTTLLAGCASAPPAPAVTSAAPIPPGITALKTKFPATFDADAAKTETLRVADAMEALVDKTAIVTVDSHDELIPATSDAAAYYGVIRVINLGPKVDPITLATTIASLLRSTGWIERKTSTDASSYAMALSSDADVAKSWFLVLTGDASVSGQPIVSIQLASPDLP